MKMNPPDDDLIAEARRAGSTYIASFGGDLAAVCDDLRRRAREQGRRVLRGHPRPPHPWQHGSRATVAAHEAVATE